MMEKNLKTIGIIICICLIFVFSMEIIKNVSATSICPASQEDYTGRLKCLILQLLCLIVYIIIPIIMIMIAIGGLMQLSDNPKTKNQGKHIIVNAILGVAIIGGFVGISGIFMDIDVINECHKAGKKCSDIGGNCLPKPCDNYAECNPFPLDGICDNPNDYCCDCGAMCIVPEVLEIDMEEI